MAGRLAGKVALITGTAGGQGRAAALLFAREGARVVGCDLKEAEGLETTRLIEAEGGQSVFRRVDLGDAEQVRSWIEFAVETFGGIDILYNNAAAAKFAPLEEMTYEDWRFTVRNELDIIYHTCQLAFPYLKRRGGGAIINTASIAGMYGVPNLGNFAHAATKGGVIGLTRQLAIEGAPFRIRANSISPGLIETPATEHLDLEFKQAYLRAVPLERLGQPEDVAYAALFLAADESSYITGVNIVVDGGKTAL